ncbi:hypothetical protein [Robertkochia solimangrovi]|uniref:DUF7793 family protein n=1 Tax=Robertkochia solimangrovi TaxID=2213046 RepID=UPI00117FB820|nr:hypothetical protein [Robertkochia solimangrovi]TRZ46099.1 hypothetical protein DMZ48_02195 [Robertkochia solimangrovi]
MAEKILSEKVRIWLEKDVIYVVFCEFVTIDYILASQIVSYRMILQNGQTYPMICDLSSVKGITLKARRFLRREGLYGISAMIFIAPSPLALVYYLQFMYEPPPFTVILLRSFQEVRSALYQLNQL